MRLTFRDHMATLLVAGIAVPYLGYLVFGMMPFILNARGMAGTGMVLGLTACIIGARTGDGLDAGFWLLGLLGAATLAAGISALVSGNGTLLALFMGGIGVLWLLSTLRHAYAVPVPDVPPPNDLISRW
jgi:hypothetical protein